MAEEKKGLLSRLGFGRKKAEEEAARLAAEAKAKAEAEAARQVEELERKRRIAAEKAEAERVEAERLLREKAAREAEQQKLVEERAARQRAESERRERERAEEDARKLEAQKAAAAKKAEAKRKREEAAAQRKAEAARVAGEAKAKREAEMRLAAEKAEAERAAQVEREKAEAEARQEEKARVAREEAERKAREEAAKAEEAKLKAGAKAEAEAKSKTASPAPEPGSRDVVPSRSRPRVKPGDTGSRSPKSTGSGSERLGSSQRELSPAMLQEASGKAPPPEPEPEGSIFTRMSRGLKRSSTKLTDNVVGAFSKRLLDDEALEELEDMLIASDLGVRPSLRIVERLQDQRFNTTVDDSEVRAAMSAVVTDILKPFEAQLKLRHEPGSGELDVVLFTGVNGSGKTTTLGKLAAKFRDAGYTVLIAAGDTFRAAANEQLAVWSERAEAPIMETKQGADAAGLVYDAMTRAKEDGYDVLMIDTAGRLQNRTELMDELSKIVRVIRKQDPSAPHHSLLVLDATVGQNALSQVEVFKDVAGVTGLVMTKLDGTAKGGVLVNLTDQHELPIHFVGIGERLEDLEVFDADAYARALSGSVG